MGSLTARFGAPVLDQPQFDGDLAQAVERASRHRAAEAHQGFGDVAAAAAAQFQEPRPVARARQTRDQFLADRRLQLRRKPEPLPAA